MAKLNQIIALVSGRKSNVAKAITEQYHLLDKPELFNGQTKEYQPLDEDGETFPSDDKKVQLKVGEVLNSVQSSLESLWDLIGAQDKANTQATANIEVDGKTLAKDIPVTHLLFLEKQVTDLGSIISRLPVLDPSKDWKYSNDVDSYITEPVKTVKTKKTPRNHVRAEATKEHPAQVDVFTEDVAVGHWLTRHMSGAIPAATKHKLEERLSKLKDAIKIAREKGNEIEVTDMKYAKEILNFVFDEK